MKTRLILLLLVLLGSQFQVVQAETEALSPQQLDDSIRINIWYGGWEADYTKTAYEMMFSYRNISDLHLYAGFGDAEQVFYDRSKTYAGAYYFYQDYSYFKLFFSEKNYEYPLDPQTLVANPDSSSYDQVPGVEFEISNLFSNGFRATVGYEVTQPNFFYDPDRSIENIKLYTELSIPTVIPQLRTKLYAALLRDPDPKLTEIKGRDNPHTSGGIAAITTVKYQTSTHKGVAIEYIANIWELEIKYLENRDLDGSYDYSLLNQYIYRLDPKRYLQFDYVYDTYSNESYLAGKTADVIMLSYYQEISAKYKFGIGYKQISVPDSDDSTAFISLQVKTGVL